MAGDIFQWKLDQCFSHLKNVIIIADDIMIVGEKQQRACSSCYNLTGNSKEMQCFAKLQQAAKQKDRG